MKRRPVRIGLAAGIVAATVLVVLWLCGVFTPAPELPPPSQALIEAWDGLDVVLVEASLDTETSALSVSQTLTLKNRTGQTQEAAVLRTWPNAFQSPDTSPAAAEEALYESCYPDGFSMGALMALYLSTVHEVEAVITINCPVYFLNVPQGIRRFLMDLRCRDFSETRMVFHSMRKTTLHSNIEFLKIHHLMYPVLKRVTVPVYCNQTLDDRTVFGRPSLRYLLKNLPSKAKSYTLYRRGDHQILMGPYKERLISNILTYLKRYE